MPQFTITISQAHLDRLQAVVSRYNAQAGASLTVKDWIVQTLKEVAIADHLAAGVDQLRAQAQADAQAALEAAARAERQRLLQAL